MRVIKQIFILEFPISAGKKLGPEVYILLYRYLEIALTPEFRPGPYVHTAVPRFILITKQELAVEPWKHSKALRPNPT